MRLASDIDIDVADRQQLLDLIDVIPASMIKDGKLTKHNSGVYATDIPVDPFTGVAGIEYQAAESRGYLKLDLLNLGIYKQVNSEEHLLQLLQEPDWAKLYEREFCEKLIHISAHYDTLIKMPEPVTSIERMAMFLAIIRPAKRHLIGKLWSDVAKEVWNKPNDDSYYFKHSHSISYAMLVVVNMNLLEEQTVTNSK